MQQRLNTRVNKVSVAEQLRGMSSARAGGLVTADELTGSLMQRCVDWTPADFEDAKLLINDYLYALQNDGVCVRVNRGIWKATSSSALEALLTAQNAASYNKESVVTQQDSINLQTANIQSESTNYGQAVPMIPVPTPRRKDRGDHDQQERKIVRCCLCRQKMENPGQPISCGQFSLKQLLDKLMEIRPEISGQLAENIRNQLVVSETATDQQQSQTTDRTRRSSCKSEKAVFCYLCKRQIENPGQPISCGQYNLKQLLEKLTELQPSMSSQIKSKLSPAVEQAESKSTIVARKFEQQVAVSSQQWAAASMPSTSIVQGQQPQKISSSGQYQCSFCQHNVSDKDAVTCGSNTLEQLLQMLSDALDAETIAAAGQCCTHRTPGTP